MDQAVARKIDSKIREYAEALPEGQRDDFTQDMWVLILAIEVPTSGVNEFLNLTLFRARENWTARLKYRGRSDPLIQDPDAVPDPSAGAEVMVEAAEAIDELVGALREAEFTADEIEAVVEGLRDGLTQKDIALALGRTPQGLNYHMKKVRAA